MTHQKKIDILRVTHLRGPNIWTYRPVIEAWLDIGELEDFPSNTIPGFYDRLVGLLPSLIEHHCSPGVRGGFLQRVQEGTWAAHIVEHVTLELQNLAGMQTGFGKARQTSQRGVYKVAFRTRQVDVGRAALHAARDLVVAVANDTPYDVATVIASLRDMVDSLCLGPSTAHIVDAATDRQIPHIRLTDGNLVQIGYGVAQRRIWTAETDQTSAIAEEIASDKDLTKSLLKACGVPVPEGQLVSSIEEAWDAAQDIGVPVVVKPTDANHGRGVFTNLTTQAEVVEAYHAADKEGNGVLVEKFIEGEAHRLLVVGRSVVAATRGKLQTVVGDGRSSVLELIDSQINSDPRCGEAEEFPLEPLVLSKEPIAQMELSRQGLSGESVPLAGQTVLVKRHGDLAFDETDDVHPRVAAMACLAARVVGLDVAGIDLVAKDITRPLQDQGGAVIEVNAGPGLLMHLKPAEGKPRPVGKAIINHLFQAESSGRIPVVGITGTKNTGRIARLVAWLVHISGKHVGLACSEGMYLDGRQIVGADSTHWEAGQRLLINRSVQAAVFENPSKTILGEGLAYDKCTVGVVTDVSWQDHLTHFDILDAEQNYKVARTQVDVVLPSGTAVLNADDAQAVEMAGLCDGKVIFYGLNAAHAAISAHLNAGERAIFLRDQTIVMAQGRDDVALLPLSNLKPAKASKPDMVMAAVAAAWALNIPVELIAAGLRTFESSHKKTPY